MTPVKVRFATLGTTAVASPSIRYFASYASNPRISTGLRHSWEMSVPWSSVEHMFEQFETTQAVLPERDFSALAAAIAAIPPVQPGGSALAAAAELRALTILQRRLAGVVLERLASFDAQGFALASGSASTAAWVRAYTNVTGPAASSLVAAARTSRTLPALAAELTVGRIGVEHLQAVARSTAQVPDDVLAQHDATLRDM